MTKALKLSAVAFVFQYLLVWFFYYWSLPRPVLAMDFAVVAGFTALLPLTWLPPVGFALYRSLKWAMR